MDSENCGEHGQIYNEDGALTLFIQSFSPFNRRVDLGIPCSCSYHVRTTVKIKASPQIVFQSIYICISHWV